MLTATARKLLSSMNDPGGPQTRYSAGGANAEDGAFDGVEADAENGDVAEIAQFFRAGDQHDGDHGHEQNLAGAVEHGLAGSDVVGEKEPARRRTRW